MAANNRISVHTQSMIAHAHSLFGDRFAEAVVAFKACAFMMELIDQQENGGGRRWPDLEFAQRCEEFVNRELLSVEARLRL